MTELNKPTQENVKGQNVKGRSEKEPSTPSQRSQIAPNDGPVAVVLAGAGARGAYEAGMLSVLLPELDKLGKRPTMFLGTSAGSINAVLFASLAHLPADVAAKEAVERWQKIRKSSVMRPAMLSLPMVGLRYAASVLGFPLNNVSALLDTGPLLASLENPELIDWGQLKNNLSDPKLLDTVALATTEYTGGSSGRTKVFYSTTQQRPVPPTDTGQAIDYIQGDLTANHVRASAAIPVAFPPVLLGEGANARWHMDGGVRLNVPLKPAVTLGADNLVVIATDPPRYQAPPPGPAPTAPPQAQDAVDQILHGASSDRMIEDLQNLYRTNQVVMQADAKGLQLKSSSGQREYRKIPVIFGGPPVIDDVGRTAANSLGVILRGVNQFLNPDLWLLNFLLGSSPRTRPDLMSYVLFEPEMINESIVLGQEHASNLLPLMWGLENR